MVDETPPKAGHNSKATIAVEKLRSLVERIENLEKEKKEVGGCIKDMYAEAKSGGFDVTVLRQLIRLRRKDADEVEQDEALLHTYKRALE